MTPPYIKGDVLKAEHDAWPKGSFIQGEVYEFGGPEYLYVCGWQVSQLTRPYWKITVISRALRPFYVNVARKPVAGDIFRSDDPADDDDNLTFSPSSHTGFWENLSGDTVYESDLPPLRRLLIDGTTGKPVTP